MLDLILRPNGKPYHPRKVIAYECGAGVLVLGTHDVPRAQALADSLARELDGSRAVAADPLPGWWRDGMENGERTWVFDEVRGRAGVWFREIAEIPGSAR